MKKCGIIFLLAFTLMLTACKSDYEEEGEKNNGKGWNSCNKK